MRIEEHCGNRIVCGHIFPKSEIMIGSKWQGSGGSIVTVESIDNFGWVTYSWDNGESRHKKESFSFQCRYCLIIE